MIPGNAWNVCHNSLQKLCVLVFYIFSHDICVLLHESRRNGTANATSPGIETKVLRTIRIVWEGRTIPRTFATILRKVAFAFICNFRAGFCLIKKVC